MNISKPIKRMMSPGGMTGAIQTVSLAAVLFFVFAGSADGRIIINEVNMGSQDYFEIYNYDVNPIDLTGYTAEFWDSGLGGFNPLPVIGFPTLTMAANSVLTFHENANTGAGEIDTPNLWMHPSRDLSIVIRDTNGDIVDLWAHGDNFFGPPDADQTTVPLNSLPNNTNNTTYQRFVVQGGNEFDATDWAAAPATRNSFNAAQVVAVPEPSTWAFMLIGIIALTGVWFTQRAKIDSDAEAAAELPSVES